jgi:hypothetical protein
MKVLVARKELKCNFCPQPIHKGDFMVRSSFKDRLNSNRWVFTFYHEECCCQQTYKNIRVAITNQRVALIAKIKTKESKKRKIGRPCKYSNRLESLRLRSKIQYYKNKGNEAKVNELSNEMKKLEIVK